MDIALRSKIFMMGSGADLIASLNGITRLEADAQALKSQQKALYARKNNYFKSKRISKVILLLTLSNK